MKKVLFLKQECMGVKVLAERLIPKLDVLNFTASNLEFGRKMKNGKFEIVTENEIAKEYLKSGKGVYYKGYVYFQANKIEDNEHFKTFNKKQERFAKELNRKVNEEYLLYLNGALYEALQDITHFPMVKSMIQLYEKNIFSVELLETKLQNYLKPESVQVVLNELHQSVEKAG